MNSSLLIQALRAFLFGGDAAAFAEWCESHSSGIEAITSRGELLRLKHGNRAAARQRLQILVPCPKCSDLPWSFPVSLSDSHADFHRLLEQLEASEAVQRRQGSLFVCRHCGAERQVELPEREFSGEIKVVG